MTSKWGLRHGTQPLSGHVSIKGVLRMGTTRKKELLRTGLMKKRILVTDVPQNGVFVMINWWGCTLTD